MLTKEIMNVYKYDSVGGPIHAIPVGDVLRFLYRIQSRIQDTQDNTICPNFVSSEIRDTINKLCCPPLPQLTLPRCQVCNRVIGDYHHPQCKIRGDSTMYVKEHHCTTKKGEN